MNNNPIHIRFTLWRRILILFGVSIRLFIDEEIYKITTDSKGNTHIYTKSFAVQAKAEGDKS